MELCVPRLVSNVPHPRGLSSPKTHLGSSRPAFSVNRGGTSLTSLTKSVELHNKAAYLLRSTTSEDTYASISKQFKEEPTKTMITDDTDTDDVEAASETKNENPVPAEEAISPSGQEPMEAQFQAFQFLDKFNLELEPEEIYPYLLYGGGSSLALWISSAIVDSIDSIPVIPKVLEIVGLGFTIWFSYRYLIFKKNRDELVAKIEELKQEIVGRSEE